MRGERGGHLLLISCEVLCVAPPAGEDEKEKGEDWKKAEGERSEREREREGKKMER